MRTILLLDDDRELCELLTEYLRPEGFTVSSVHNGEAGLAEALASPPDLVLLDVMLPGRSGFDVLRELRNKSRVPVLMLTAKGEEIDRIVGLELGADDYLPKPFNPRELIARIRAILRRGERTAPDVEGRLVVDDIELDPGARSVHISGTEVELTSVEFKLLEALMRSPGKVVSRDHLARTALDRTLAPFERSLDVHVSNLRRKLGTTNEGASRIKTLRGEGYLLACTGTR